jgi:hypothetical protein
MRTPSWRLLQAVMDRDWEPTSAGRALHEAASGDQALLRRVWVALLSTHNPRTATGRSALVTLTTALSSSTEA